MGGAAVPPNGTAAPHGAGASQGAGEQALVVAELGLAAAVRMSGVEHGHARRERGRDCVARERLVAVGVGRHAHAAEADAELRGVKPTRTIQAP